MTFKRSGTDIFDTNRILSSVTVNLISDTGTIEVTAGSPSVGTIAGYLAGGATSPGIIGSTNVDKYPFSSDTNSTSVGTLTSARYNHASQSSQNALYMQGGMPATPVNPGGDYRFTERYPFADGNSTSYIIGCATSNGDWGWRGRTKAVGVSSVLNGYYGGGYGTSSPFDGGASWNSDIKKFSFFTNSDSSSYKSASLTASRINMAGANSTTVGYFMGGILSNTAHTNAIDRFPFATDANSTATYTLSDNKAFSTGISSSTYAYSIGGMTTPPGNTYTNTMDRFPFASETNATSVASLNSVRSHSGGFSSANYGYVAAGYKTANPASVTNDISKFSFASEATSSAVGTMSTSLIRPAGGQD
jgi:hypothetical protein